MMIYYSNENVELPAVPLRGSAELLRTRYVAMEGIYRREVSMLVG